MKRIWATIDRWGPGVITVLTLFFVIYFGWTYSERLSRSEGKVEALQHQLDARNAIEVGFRTEVQTWQAYVINLRSKMFEYGIHDVPPPPQPVAPGAQGKR